MHDLLEDVYFRKDIIVKGKKWISLKYLRNNLHLAIKAKTKYPIKVYLVKEDG